MYCLVTSHAPLATLLLLFATSTLAAEPTLAERLEKVPVTQFSTAPGYSEGPTWLGGKLFFCSGPLLRATGVGTPLTHLDIGPAGTCALADGRLLICDNKTKALLVLTPAGRVGVLADQFAGAPLNSLNDLSVDPRGNVYWTDPAGSSADKPIGNVFRLRPDGNVSKVATGLAFPNGLDVDPHGKFLYVIESQSKKILRYPLPADDQPLGAPETFYDLGGSGGDGCAFDAAGNLWAADFHRPDLGRGRITVLSPAAKVLGHVVIPAKVVSNVTFGGPDHNEIFCTTGDPPGVFRAPVGVAGFRGHGGAEYKIVRYLDLVPQQRIVFVGDSITDGHTYPLLVRQALADAGRGAPVCINAGVAGDTAKGMRARIERDVLVHRPTLVTLSAGINDVFRGVTPEDYIADVTAIADQLDAKKIPLMILTTTILGPRHAEHHPKLAKYNESLRKLAKERGYPLAEVNGVMQAAENDMPTTLGDDQVHLSLRGYDAMTRAVLDALGHKDIRVPESLRIDVADGLIREWRILPLDKADAPPLDDAAVANLKVDDTWRVHGLPEEKPIDEWWQDQERKRGVCQALGQRFAPATKFLGHATIDAPQPRDVYFNTGAQLETIWLNGKRIYKSTGWTGWHPGKERIAAHLEAGKNSIVIETGPAFFLSVTDNADW